MNNSNIYDTQYRFIHVNKCGGKSLNHSLNEMLTKKRKEYHEVHGLVGTPVTKNAKGKLILFVRDPIERAISSYHYDRVKKRQYDLDFNDYIRNIQKDSNKMNTHLRFSLSWYIDPEQMKDMNFFFVGTLENISDDYKKLIEKLEIPKNDIVELPHFNMTIRLGHKVDPKNLDFLREYYKKDYECLDILEKKGYITKKYLDNILEKKEYTY